MTITAISITKPSSPLHHYYSHEQYHHRHITMTITTSITNITTTEPSASTTTTITMTLTTSQSPPPLLQHSGVLQPCSLSHHHHITIVTITITEFTFITHRLDPLNSYNTVFLVFTKQQSPSLNSRTRTACWYHAQSPSQPRPRVYFLPMDLPILDSSQEWTHTMWALWDLTLFTQPNVFKVHPCYKLFLRFFLQ